MNKAGIQRNFIIGDEWNYFKVYTGFKTADAILTDCIYPLALSLEAAQIVDKWFFIRYADPKFHLRLRFHVNNPDNVPAVIMNFNQAIKNYVHNRLVWKVQTDTYNRELERYGSDTIEAAETLFHYDSKMICRLIALDAVKKDEHLRWLAGLKMIDLLLSDFGFSLEEKLKLFNTLQENFGKEFGITKDYRHQFGQKYRNEKAKIEKALHSESESAEEFKAVFEPVFQKRQTSSAIVEHIKQKVQENAQLQLNDLLSSYIHMLLNRLFRTQQRMHELVLYDYLFRYYSSIQARQKR
ncbi:MAG: thiopeptide-type bacteriocin biosynthesis protein [Bacteroidales bacterium]|nr:thiopeptide-type bacteriocin biosynthesis protein [Bacteroidales bacterium]